jgi:hypothetical protein
MAQIDEIHVLEASRRPRIVPRQLDAASQAARDTSEARPAQAQELGPRIMPPSQHAPHGGTETR